VLFGISIEELLARLRDAKRYKFNGKASIDTQDIGAIVLHERGAKPGKYALSADALELAYIKALVHDSKYATCEICMQTLRRANLGSHLRKVHPKPTPELAIGRRVLNDLGKWNWKATGVERCDICLSRIVWLDVGKGAVKAFDVDEDRTIVGTHACDDSARRGHSIRTVCGGAIDSNRRRH
jgi:hypothetical protein